MIWRVKYEPIGGGLGYTIRNGYGHLHSAYVQESDADTFCAILNALPWLRDAPRAMPGWEDWRPNGVT